MNNIKDKIKHLNEYLEKNYHVSILDVLKISEEELTNKLKEKDLETIKKIADIFYLESEILLNDEEELPHDDHLKVDELLIQIRQGNYVNETENKKNKNVIKRNFNLLDKKLKTKLVRNLVLCFIPLLAIVIYAFTSSITNVVETIDTYSNGDVLSSSQQEIENELLENDKKEEQHFANVKVGVSLENIQNISSSNSNYTATLVTSFDFDQIEYFKMYYYKNKNVEFNSNKFYTDDDFLADNFCFNSDNTSYLPYKDNIPDILQFNFEENKHMSSSVLPQSISTIYLEQLKAYPGEKSSNVFTDKNDEFRIGNGRISADSLEFQDKGTPYFDSKTNSYRYSQRLHFQAVINKTFDSPRYPLDSAQFKIYIQPTRSSSYVRYVADSEASGYSTYFSIGNGYRLIKEKNGMKNFNIKLNYYKDKDIDHSSSTFNQDIIKTQIEIVVRANKHGISVYLNSFLNIIAVAIWLILAFYNQSFNKDDSMSMIGTGFFSAISAILLGLSTVGIANTFSLLTFVNVFTLVMVLVMGFEVIKARRYNKLGNASLIAYSTVKMRVLFYFLAICSILIYIIIPAISYIWLL